jgi:flagellar biosynthesis protein FlhB
MASERTEPATPRKLRKAREQGQVWQSRDLTGGVVLVAALGALAWQGPVALERLRSFMAAVFRVACSASPPAPGAVLQAGLSTATACLVPVLGVATLAAAATALVQVRPLFTLEPLKPRLERLDPVAGLKRLFGVRGLFAAAISLAKALVVAAVLTWTLLGELRDLVALAHAGSAAGVAAAGHLLWTMLWRGALVMLALSVVDVLYQRHQFLKDQRMTKDEVKREHREAEGDQSLKGERKRLHQELLEQAMIDQVRRADVVIVNPDHIAVALGYQPGEDEAPVVLASGQNLVAQRIIEVARHHGVPVLRDVHLARSLAGVAVGERIPEELYEAVAEVLRFVLTDPNGGAGG